MDDLISRSAAIDAADKIIERDTSGSNAVVNAMIAWSEYIRTLPSAQPEQSSEIQDILDYLDTVLHPIVSPEHWNVYSELHDMISTLPSAQPEPKWIPCSERLPKDEIAYYLVTLVNHGLLTYGDIDIARWDYDRRKGKESWHWCKEREVIAWMPLPEPYQEERREE